MAWQRTDDLTGEGPAEQVTFGLDGKAYTVDLGSQNHQKLREALQKFVTVATEYGTLPGPEQPPAPAADPPATNGRVRPRTRVRTPPRAARTRGKGSANGVKTSTPHRTIRSWANQNGYMVTPKGRIPDRVIKAYEDATG